MRAIVTVLVALGVALAMPPAAEGRGWAAPVPGAVTRAFDFSGNPYAGGLHRGADLAARPGARVRSACAGRVVMAGRVGILGRVVTVRCGPWRVSHLPLGRVAVRPGWVIRRGAPIGTAAGATRHDGLHLGVRRDGRRFGYVDPLRSLGDAPGDLPPVAGPGPGSRVPRRVPEPLPVSAPPGSRPVRAPAPPHADGVAPWPVWAGLALLATGAAGAGVRRRPGRRAPAAPRPVSEPVRSAP